MPPLPSFAEPPVTEVVLASRFRPVDTYSVIDVARLADQVADEGFTVIEEKPGYEAPGEPFSTHGERAQVSLEFLAGPPPTRYWFLTPDGSELLQIQPNWIAANWRKVTPRAEYGRWDSRWNAFAKWLHLVERQIAPEDGLKFDQVEVTYINHIDRRGIWRDHGDAARVFTFLRKDDSQQGFLPKSETTRSELAFMIPDRDGSPLGRLHARLDSGFRQSGREPVFLLNLTARGRPLESGIDGVQRFAELGHEWIVRGFADMTTSHMHEVWGRED